MTRPTPCAANEPRLTAYLLGDLPPAEAADVQAHLHDCPACRERVRELEPTLALLRSTLTPNVADQPRLEKARRDAVFAARHRPGLFAWLCHPQPMWLKAAALVAVSAAMLLVWNHPAREPAEPYGRVAAQTTTEASPAPAPAAAGMELNAPAASDRIVPEQKIANAVTVATPADSETPTAAPAPMPATEPVLSPADAVAAADSAGPRSVDARPAAPLLPARPAPDGTPAEAETVAPAARKAVAAKSRFAAPAAKAKTDTSAHDGLPATTAPSTPRPLPAARTWSLRLGGAETAAALDAGAKTAALPEKIMIGFAAKTAPGAATAAGRDTKALPVAKTLPPAPLMTAKEEAGRIMEPVLPEHGATTGATTTTEQDSAPAAAEDDLAPTSVGDSAVAALDLAYPAPAAGRQLALHTEIGPSPCRPGHRLLLIGVTAGTLPLVNDPIAGRRNGETTRAAAAATMPALPAGGLRHLQVRIDLNPQQIRNSRVLAVAPAGSPWQARPQHATIELGSLSPGGSATVILDLEAPESAQPPLGTVRVSFSTAARNEPVVGGLLLSRERDQRNWDMTSIPFRLAACAAELALARYEPGQDAASRVAALVTKVEALTVEAPDNPRVTQLLRWVITPADTREP